MTPRLLLTYAKVKGHARAHILRLADNWELKTQLKLYSETGLRLFSRSTVRIGELPLGTVTAYDTTEAQAVTRAYRSPPSTTAKY